MKKEDSMLIYELLLEKMNESQKDELSIHDFKQILKYFRVSPKMWIVIRRELKSLGAIKYTRNKILLRCDINDKNKNSSSKKTTRQERMV